MSDNNTYIGEIHQVVIDPKTKEPKSEKILYPITVPSAIKGLEAAVQKINKNIDIRELSISGNGTKYIDIPIIDGLELVQVVSLSGVDYICHGFCLDDASYKAELANSTSSSDTIKLKCVYIRNIIYES